MKKITNYGYHYDTDEWDVTRNGIYVRAGCKCEMCGASHMGLNAHHILPIYFGGPFFEMSNLMCLCDKCHYLEKHPYSGNLKNKYKKRLKTNLCYNVIRDIIIKRFKGKCVECGENNHLTFQQIVDRPFKSNELNNFECVCEKCQTNLDQNIYKKKLQKYHNFLKNNTIEKINKDAKQFGNVEDEEKSNLDWEEFVEWMREKEFKESDEYEEIQEEKEKRKLAKSLEEDYTSLFYCYNFEQDEDGEYY